MKNEPRVPMIQHSARDDSDQDKARLQAPTPISDFGGTVCCRRREALSHRVTKIIRAATAVFCAVIAILPSNATAQFGRLGSIAGKVTGVSDALDMFGAAKSGLNAVEAIRELGKSTNVWRGTYRFAVDFGKDTTVLFVRTYDNGQIPVPVNRGGRVAQFGGMIAFGFAHPDSAMLPRSAEETWKKDTRPADGAMALFMVAPQDTSAGSGRWAANATVMGDTVGDSPAARIARMVLRSGAFDFNAKAEQCRKDSKKANAAAARLAQPPACDEKTHQSLAIVDPTSFSGSLTVDANSEARFSWTVPTDSGPINFHAVRVSMTTAGRTKSMF